MVPLLKYNLYEAETISLQSYFVDSFSRRISPSHQTLALWKIMIRIRASHLQTQLFFDVTFADFAGRFRRARVVRHAVEFDDRPAVILDFAERVEHPWQIDSALTEFDETVGGLSAGCA